MLANGHRTIPFRLPTELLEQERTITLVGEVDAQDMNAWFAHMRKTPGRVLASLERSAPFRRMPALPVPFPLAGASRDHRTQPLRSRRVPQGG